MRYTGGIELAKQYYEEFGRPMLEEQFGGYIPQMAIGLAGHGSECYGYDDEISVDHDVEPGFCIWINDEADKQFGFKLMRAYMKLPKEYHGLKLKESSVYGTRGRGVHTIWDFYSEYIGMRRLPQTPAEWLNIPSFRLAEATNGVVFSDPSGEFTSIRHSLINDMPDDVWSKRLSMCLFEMAQKGQYNFERCLKHGEKGAAVLCFNEYAKNLIEAVFILNKVHMPYYKWSIRAMKGLESFSSMAPELENALADPLNSHFFIERSSAEIKAHIVAKYGLKDIGDYLEGYSYALNDTIKDHFVRNFLT